MQLTELTIKQAADAIAAGRLGVVEYAEALLAQAQRVARLNAYIHLDPEQVRAAARDAERRRGAKSGPLFGIPLALKDNLDTAGIATTGGTPGLRENVPARNAPVVQRLLDAGAIAFGKANMHELAYGITNNNSAFGAACNPWTPSCIPGGSSGGTGVAVAARTVPAGIGTDTGGSVRVPAALCGIVGFRPTTGRWSQAGIVPISRTRDTAGPLARSVADCALLDAVVTGGRVVDAPSPLRGLRLGVPRRFFWENLASETARVSEQALERLRSAGIELVDVDLADAGRLDAEAGFPIALYETVEDLGRYLAEHGSALDFKGLAERCASPDVRGLLTGLAGAGAIPQQAYHQALEVGRPALQQVYRRVFESDRVDALVFPTTPLPAAPIGDDETTDLGGQQVPTFLT
ncbi:MAG TPA: indoleacetamide hydrolase, partial [Burkholderiaceae bacterium]|nr:indoleacetamide hydrolase [Burkholderiaceae bacterium]